MSKTILLADDSLTIQKVVELTFSDTDFDVIATSSGDELLEKLPSISPDLIICDTIMPGTDGYQVCQKIKSDPDALHIPVILLTGTFEPFDRDRALAAGCSEIITKPFEARKLVETVARLAAGEMMIPASPESLDGAIPPPKFSPADTQDPATEEALEEFGTMLSEAGAAPLEAMPEQPDEGLDFTSTGFAAMEEAGREADAFPTDVAKDGLTFEFGDDSEAGEGELAGELQEDPKESEPTQPVSRVEIEAAAASEIAQQPDEAQDFLPEADPAPYKPMRVEPVPEIHEEGFSEKPTAEPETSFVSSAAEVPELTEIPGEDAFGAEPETSDADTSPVLAPAPGMPPSLDGGLNEISLTEADIDRIARRVVELTSDRLEQIAWEVIPDMAEIVVRERVRDLEAEIDGAGVPSDAS